MKRNFQIIVICTLVILLLRFFDATFINATLVNYTSYLVILGAIALSVPHFFSFKGGFVFPVQLIFIGIVLSMAMAYLSWGQGIKDTLIETLPYLTWVSFFYLLKSQIPTRTIERIVLAFGVAYVILYFFQLSQSPTVWFGKSMWGEEFVKDRGVFRIIFPGAGIFILSIFISLNKLTTNQPGKPFWLFMAFMGLLVPMLQVTRQFTFFVSMLYLFHLTKRVNVFQKILIMGSAAVFIFVLLNSDLVFINGMVEAGQRDANLGQDYIRVLAGEYFLTDFSQDFLARILGNGAPYFGFSEYGMFVEKLGAYEGYFLSDVGIIAVYAMFGILPVIGYILIWIKSFKIPVPKEYQYLKYYLWYLLFTSLTWYTVYHTHYIMSTVFTLYIYHTIWSRTMVATTQEGEEVEVFVPIPN